MQLELPDDDTPTLKAVLKQASEQVDRHVSGAAWLQGAVRVADADADVARRIAEAAPDTGYGGARRGAGRPRKIRKEEEAPDGTDGHDEEADGQHE